MKAVLQKFDDTLLDVEGAAALLLVKTSTVYAWVFQRRIPFRKHGRRTVFSRSALLEWSALRQCEATDSWPFEPLAVGTDPSGERRSLASSLTTKRNVRTDRTSKTREVKHDQGT